MNRLKKILLCGLVPVLLMNAAMATGRGDLSARFANEPTIEYMGESYRVKNRMSSLLFAIAEEGRIELLLVVAVDDDTCRAIPIRIQPESALHGGAVGLAYEQDLSTQDEKYIALLAAVNELFPHAVVQHYVGLDAAGLDLVDGGSNADDPDREAALWNRLRNILHASGAASNEDLTAWMDTLSPYTCTDLTSGGMMRIVDKIERYTRMPVLEFEGISETASDGTQSLRLDEAAMLPHVADCFYEKVFW